MDNFLEKITLTDEDGQEVDFDVITKLEVETDEYFIVTLSDEDSDEAIALKVVKGENGEEMFETVEDDEEFSIVVDAYETLCEEGLI